MNIMIAAVDTSLESPLAKGLSHSSWYLITNPETQECEPCPTMNFATLEEIFPWLSDHDISTVLTGSEGTHSRIFMSSNKVLIEFAEPLTVSQAIERWKKGELALLDSSPGDSPGAEDKRDSLHLYEGTKD